MKTNSLSRLSIFTIKTLGVLIQSARKDRKMSQANLAERLNVSRNTIIAIERGDPKVAVGIVFEASFILGIPLLSESKEELHQLAKTVTQFNAILPKRIRAKKESKDDNF